MHQSEEVPYPSRSDRKRVDKPVQDLARQLAELAEEACLALPAPDDLKGEILAAIRTKAHGARKRQIKHLASLLRRREEDAEVLAGALKRQAASHRSEVQTQRDLEDLRERICDPDFEAAAVEEAVRRFPGLDRKNLHRLAQVARAAKETGDRQAYREIFRRLRRAQEAEGMQGEQAEDE